MKRFLLCLVSLGLLILGAIVAPASASAATTPPRHFAECVFEDGSGAGQVIPCIWDGLFSGNGGGASYIVTQANPVISQGLSDAPCASPLPGDVTCRNYPIAQHQWRNLNTGRVLIMDPYPRGGIGNP